MNNKHKQISNGLNGDFHPLTTNTHVCLNNGEQGAAVAAQPRSISACWATTLLPFWNITINKNKNSPPTLLSNPFLSTIHLSPSKWSSTFKHGKSIEILKNMWWGRWPTDNATLFEIYQKDSTSKPWVTPTGDHFGRPTTIMISTFGDPEISLHIQTKHLWKFHIGSRF